MGQLLFQQNIIASNEQITINNGSISFFPFNIYDSLSLSVFNCLFLGSNANKTVSLSIGLYSLNGSTLSLSNSISGTRSQSDNNVWYASMTATSATQNITPGTWWFGILASTGGNSSVAFIGQTKANAANAFPGGFIGGRMTASSNALPSSYATSDLDITGNDAMAVPMIILST